MTKDIERFEEVFKKSIQTMHDVNVKQYGVAMANIMLPALEQMKPIFKIVYEQGVTDGSEKLEGCVVVPVESCKWTQDEDSNWWTQCGEGFVFNEDSHPHKHNFKNCCFCGGLLEAARGGNE